MRFVICVCVLMARLLRHRIPRSFVGSFVGSFGRRARAHFWLASNFSNSARSSSEILSGMVTLTVT